MNNIMELINKLKDEIENKILSRNQDLDDSNGE